jgi:cytidylate kinase
MKPVAIAIAGRMASGKSTIAECLANDLACPLASFGDFVRKVTRERGLPETRPVWQEVGQGLVSEDCAGFCKSVLSEAGWRQGKSVVVEGVRHQVVLEQLRSLVSPMRLLFVFVTVPDETRHSRLDERGVHDAGQLTILEQHATEAQVSGALRESADLIVDGTRSVELAALDVMGWLLRA